MHHLQILMALCVANFFAEDFTRAGKQGDAMRPAKVSDRSGARLEGSGDRTTNRRSRRDVSIRLASIGLGQHQACRASDLPSTRLALLRAIAVVRTSLLIASILQSIGW